MTTVHWESIATLLREELAHCGHLLALFEQQQQHLFDRNAHAVLQIGFEIEAQARVLGEARLRREQAVAAFAESLGLPTSSSLRSMLSEIEADARPLLGALINDVNTLLHRLRRTSRHNHSLLARAVEVHQETIQLLRPRSLTRTYSAAGQMAVAPTAPTSTLQATG
jgi:flagellar biosynthesis/type III secretory pathway chaperone